MTRSHDHHSFVGERERATIVLLTRNPMHSACKFETSQRNPQVESGGSKDAKTLADSFCLTLLHQNTRFNTYDIVRANY